MLFLLAFLLATPLFAQTVAITPRGVVVAHDRAIELFDSRTLTRIWRADGVEHAGAIVVGENEIAILDPLNNRVRIVTLADGHASTQETAETPVAGIYLDKRLYVVARDAKVVERLDRIRASIATGAAPQFIAAANGKLYVYARADGTLQEISTSPFAVSRVARVAPFASDLEIDGRTAYLTYPREGIVRVIDVATLKATGQLRIGAVPVDLAVTGRMLAVADPSSKKVWVVEGQQSVLEAFARGFVRGLLGLGLFGNRDSAFATGVDRVVVRGSRWLAFDSSSGTLYRVTKSKSSVIARGLGPRAFALGEGSVYFWQNGTLVAQKAD